jgi:hypothetical protein
MCFDGLHMLSSGFTCDHVDRNTQPHAEIYQAHVKYYVLSEYTSTGCTCDLMVSRVTMRTDVLSHMWKYVKHRWNIMLCRKTHVFILAARVIEKFHVWNKKFNLKIYETHVKQNIQQHVKYVKHMRNIISCLHTYVLGRAARVIEWFTRVIMWNKIFKHKWTFITYTCEKLCFVWKHMRWVELYMWLSGFTCENIE